jgi:uncharacterized protein YceK
MTLSFARATTALTLPLLLGGCSTVGSIVSTTAGVAISTAGAVAKATATASANAAAEVSATVATTGIRIAGKLIEKAIDQSGEKEPAKEAEEPPKQP